MASYSNIQVGSIAYENCVACSSNVIDTYRKDGYTFLHKVFNDPQYLEQLSGLDDLMKHSTDWDLDQDAQDDF